MYDIKAKAFTTKLMGNYNIRPPCSFKLHHGPYKSLQHFIDNTTHTSNEVLALQTQCPEGLTQHEYYSFASLRAGHRLQWRNIARELTDRILNFTHKEIGQLITQSIWQAGPPAADSEYRESHVDLEEQGFGLSLLSALNKALSSTEDNWQGAPAVGVFVIIALRLLSLTHHSSVRQLCFEFLERARAITILWAREVTGLLHEDCNESDRKRLANQCLELALTCHSTYYVDSENLSIILSTTGSISVVTECAIMIHDRRPASTEGLPSSTQVMLRRFFRSSHQLEVCERCERYFFSCYCLLT